MARWPEWMTPPTVGDPTADPYGTYPKADVTDPVVRKLYGPRGETLRTFSDRPPTGFHQGSRGQPRR